MDNKTFWKRIKPLFSDKNKFLQKEYFLIENDETITNEKEVAEKINSYFIDAIEEIKLDYQQKIKENDELDIVNQIVKKYGNHPSIAKIKENIIIDKKFSFTSISTKQVQDKIIQLNSKKGTVENDIPAKILIDTNEIVSKYLSTIFNNSKNEELFPKSLKNANIIPIHKKAERSKKENYRPISLLPTVSKLYEREMYSQIIVYINKYLSPYLFGFRKGHSTENCLMVMLEEWKKAIDKKESVGGVLTDLSKAFDCLNHDLLIAKLEAYGFNHDALNLLHSYLSERKQRTKIKSSYSSWKETNYGVPQGSILGPLLFNIFINDIFFFISKGKIANYADDTTLYAAESNITELLNTLENEMSTLMEWFHSNEMKANNEKCHLLVINRLNDVIKIGEEEIKGSDSVKLLGVVIDKKLNFSDHVSNLCKKGNQKLYALARISKYMNADKLRILMKTFIESQFNYCPLIWMLHNRSLNNKINRLHERALRLVYKNPNLTFQDLLKVDNSFTIHHRNLQKLATEMFKIKNKISPTLIQNLFPTIENNYNLRNERCWKTTNVRTTAYGTETILFRGVKTWQLLPTDIKCAKTLIEFRRKIKTWYPEGCTCRLCRTFVPNVGYI